MNLAEIFSIKNKKEALLWKEMYIKELIDVSFKQKSSVRPYDYYLEIANTNIGYFSGYSKNRESIEELFDVKHPIFGSVKENGTPSPEECIKLGTELAENLIKKHEKRSYINQKSWSIVEPSYYSIEKYSLKELIANFRKLL